MAKASTEKKSNTSLEPSEIFCAVGLHMTERKMKSLCNPKDAQSGTKLLTWVSADKNGAWDIASNSQKIDMAGNDTKFKKFFKEDAVKYQVAGNPAYSSTDKDKRKQLVGAVVAGFSAAMGIRKFIKSMGDSSGKVQKVYLTGATWPADVADFRLNKEPDGFDYNSSDLVCKVNSQTFYGISLKKKTNAKGADPTMINKAYTTFIRSKKFDKAREKLFDERKKYFAQIVRDAHDDGIINFPEVEKWSDNRIWEYNFKKPDGTNVALINLKGSNDDDKPVMLSDVEGTVADKQLLKKPTGKLGLKEYINKDLSKPDNKLFGEFRKVIDENGELFAESLIDVVLKTKMASKLEAKKIGKMFFEFALVTGYADYSQRKDPNQDKLTLNTANVIPQHSILCGLANLAGNNKKYEVVYDTKQKEETNAAKVFYDLNRDGTTILKLQLRYKGNFKQQPQFMATLADGFVKQMHEECVITR